VARFGYFDCRLQGDLDFDGGREIDPDCGSFEHGECDGHAVDEEVGGTTYVLGWEDDLAIVGQAHEVIPDVVGVEILVIAPVDDGVLDVLSARNVRSKT
jgi:hypothetical protein